MGQVSFVGSLFMGLTHRGKREAEDQRRALTPVLHVFPLLCKASNLVIRPQAYSFSL